MKCEKCNKEMYQMLTGEYHCCIPAKYFYIWQCDCGHFDAQYHYQIKMMTHEMFDEFLEKIKV